MKTTHRFYDEEAGDFRRLGSFIIDHNEQIRTYSTWCIGRFADWKYGLYEHKTALPDFCERNAHLWFDGFNRLAGFVIAEDGDANFAILTLAGYRLLFEEMLQWVLNHWSDRGPTLAIEISAAQRAEAAILDRYGFCDKATFFRQTFDLTGDLVERAPLPEGFHIVDMATEPDYRAQRILRDEAFGNRIDVTDATLQRELLFYNHIHQGPIYHAPTDLCVRAPDGRLVAGCEALIDAHNAEADIERVCTHSDFRRRGFARAVIHECLLRLRDLGIQRAYITGYSQAAISLYASIGASETTTAHIYERAG